MSDIPSTGPENTAILQQNKTPSHYERVLGKEYPIQSNKIKGVIVDVKDKNITIITNPEKYSELQNTKQQTEALSEDLTLDELYDKEIAGLYEKFSLKNLDKIFKEKERKGFLGISLNDLYKGKFNDNNDIIIGNKLIKKGSNIYNEMMIKVLEELITVNKVLLMDAKDRKSKIILEFNK